MFASNLIVRSSKGNNVSKFIAIIFLLTRLSGVFPFKLTSDKRLVECNGIFYTVFPLTLTIVNVSFLFKNFVDFNNEQYFAAIVQVITHANALTYIFLSFFNKTGIQIGINACLMHPLREESSKKCKNSFLIIVAAFLTWMFFSILQPVLDRDIICFLLFWEKFILGLLEVQMCFLLFHFKGKLVDIEDEIKNTTNSKEILSSQFFVKHIYSNNFHINSLENARIKHLTVYKAINSLNATYGLANFLLTMRERFSFAFYLYCWISNGRMFDLLSASVNFFKVFWIFYSFQALKNEERELKRVVSELDSEVRDGKDIQMECLKKQVQLLDIKYEACGLFSMDLNMTISIVTTTAGYLVLLNQLNV